MRWARVGDSRREEVPRRMQSRLNSGQTDAVKVKHGLGGGTEGRLGFARAHEGSTIGVRAEYERNTSETRATTSIPSPYLHRRNTLATCSPDALPRLQGLDEFHEQTSHGPRPAGGRQRERVTGLQSLCNALLCPENVAFVGTPRARPREIACGRWREVIGWPGMERGYDRRRWRRPAPRE